MTSHTTQPNTTLKRAQDLRPGDLFMFGGVATRLVARKPGRNIFKDIELTVQFPGVWDWSTIRVKPFQNYRVIYNGQ